MRINKKALFALLTDFALILTAAIVVWWGVHVHASDCSSNQIIKVEKHPNR